MQEPNFMLDNGSEVKVFLGGDYDFLSKCLGHQGQAATYPSLTDLVTLEHLRNHLGSAHNKKCNINLRDVDDYIKNDAENLQDDRAKCNARKNAKEHNSVIDAMLFPLSNLDNLVPSILHIHLGVVLELYQDLEKVCQEIDADQDTECDNLELENLRKEISSLEDILLDVLKKMLKNDSHKTLDKLSMAITKNRRSRENT